MDAPSCKSDGSGNNAEHRESREFHFWNWDASIRSSNNCSTQSLCFSYGQIVLNLIFCCYGIYVGDSVVSATDFFQLQLQLKLTVNVVVLKVNVKCFSYSSNSISVTVSVSKYLLVTVILWSHAYSNACADVPLRTYTLTHLFQSTSFGSQGIKQAGWVIDYEIVLHGLAQQWRPRRSEIWHNRSLGDEDDSWSLSICLAQRKRMIPHSTMRNNHNMMCVLATELCNQAKACALDLGDNQSHYL